MGATGSPIEGEFGQPLLYPGHAPIIVGHPLSTVISSRSDKDIQIKFIEGTAGNPEGDSDAQ